MIALCMRHIEPESVDQIDVWFIPLDLDSSDSFPNSYAQ